MAAARGRHGGRHLDWTGFALKLGVSDGLIPAWGPEMSSPRPVNPGVTYFITRRCTQRQFLLGPSIETNRTFLYCLAYAAFQTGVEIHAIVVMSNHWHGIVTDPHARLPEFLQILHRLVASATNLALGRVENFWASEAPSVIALERPDDVLEKLAYLATNPVSAGLVKRPLEWPGLVTTRLQETLVATRPKAYFREDGAMPARLKVVCTLPPALRQLGVDVAALRFRRLVQEGVRRARRTIAAEGRRFLGRDGALTMPRDRSATTREPRRKRRPSFASRDPHCRDAARRRLRVFRQAYRVALDLWRGGDRTVRFPEGTYQMRVFHVSVIAEARGGSVKIAGHDRFCSLV